MRAPTCFLLLLLLGAGARAEEATDITANALREHVKLLSSDAWGGRGSGSGGERKATEYIAGHLERLGCEPAGDNGTFFQDVKMPGAVKVDPACSLELENGAEAFALDKDFRPFSASTSGRVSGEVVFAGYGISAPDLEYDDYGGLDVAGKIVVVFRHNPRARGWGGRVRSAHAPFARKLAVAEERGAIGLIVVNDPATFTAPAAGGRARRDALMRRNTGGMGKIPFVHMTLAASRRLFPAAFGATPEALEAEIMGGGAPRPASRAGRTGATLAVKLERTFLHGRNTCALLRAGAPDALDEVVVVGAHHDHLGSGGMGSLARNAEERRQIHNGADDNASGTSGLLEVARHLAGRRDRLRRSVLFLTFTGEERGLLGSRYFVEQPTLPLGKMVAMVNMDMIGRLEGRKLFIGGVKTSPVFDGLLTRLVGEVGIEAAFGDGGRAPSDNTSFYMKGMPVLFFFSGMHRDYHRPTDDWEKIDADGMQRIARLVARTVEELARLPERPAFQRADQGGMGPPRAILGINVDVAPEGKTGVRVASVRPNSPAGRAGLQPDDLIVAIAGEATPDPAALRGVMRKRRIGEKVKVKVDRDGATLELEITLGRG